MVPACLLHRRMAHAPDRRESASASFGCHGCAPHTRSINTAPGSRQALCQSGAFLQAVVLSCFYSQGGRAISDAGVPPPAAGPRSPPRVRRTRSSRRDNAPRRLPRNTFGCHGCAPHTRSINTAPGSRQALCQSGAFLQAVVLSCFYSQGGRAISDAGVPPPAAGPRSPPRVRRTRSSRRDNAPRRLPRNT